MNTLVTGIDSQASSTQAAWPRIVSRRGIDPALENRVSRILGQMTHAEKVGQMIQAEVQTLSPDDVRRYKLGSALNGAGVWPGKNKFSSPLDWAHMIEAYWLAAREGFRGRPFSIPFAWATDAIHGHNNLYGATLFPHNLGLGAAGDEDLIQRIGRATALEIAASGIDWTFAPTVTVPCDSRWGRFYEGYSEDTSLVSRLGAGMVAGLEGDREAAQRGEGVIATVKHWIGDGGTQWGIDRGNNVCQEKDLLEIHAAAYFGSLEAGAQVVMASFNGWKSERNYDFEPEQEPPYNYKLHGSRYLISDVLKQRMGFDGVVLTDWDGHGEISKCTVRNARYCINAGADMLMIEAKQDWLAVYESTLDDVRTGRIAPERIDDAVRRILRVKFRAELDRRKPPTQRELVRNCAEIVGCPEHRALAREAARKSLVLLKNKARCLPLPRNSRVLLAGSAIDDLTKQIGGWSLSWQGNDVSLRDFPSAKTVAMAVRDVVGDDRVVSWAEGAAPEAELARPDVAIVAIGEDAYAEMHGNIRPWRDLDYAHLKPSYATDRELIRRIKDRGIPLVVIYFGGRPLYLSPEIQMADAFIAAWLPGSEGGSAITDLLFLPAVGAQAYDFTGRLSVSWPATRRSFSIGHPGTVPGSLRGEIELQRHEQHHALFPSGYGLNYRSSRRESTLLDHIVLDPEPTIQHPPPESTTEFPILGPSAPNVWDWRVAGNGCWVGVNVSKTAPTDGLLGRITLVDLLAHQDAVELDFNGKIATFYVQLPDLEVRHLCQYPRSRWELAFSLKMLAPPAGKILLACHDIYPSQGAMDATERFARAPLHRWQEIRAPLEGIAAAGSDFCQLNVPFMLHTEARLHCQIGNVRWTWPETSGSGGGAD